MSKTIFSVLITIVVILVTNLIVGVPKKIDEEFNTALKTKNKKDILVGQ